MLKVGMQSGARKADGLSQRRSAFACGRGELASAAGGAMRMQQRLMAAADRRSQGVAVKPTARQKQWESVPLNRNGKPARRKMHVHTGDTVQVITGKDKGKVGEVLRVYRKTGKIIVRDVNLKWRYEPPQGEDKQGRMFQTEGLLDHSNVMLYSNQYQCRSRVGRTRDSKGKRKRYLVKTGEIIED